MYREEEFARPFCIPAKWKIADPVAAHEYGEFLLKHTPPPPQAPIFTLSFFQTAFSLERGRRQEKKTLIDAARTARVHWVTSVPRLLQQVSFPPQTRTYEGENLRARAQTINCVRRRMVAILARRY